MPMGGQQQQEHGEKVVPHLKAISQKCGTTSLVIAMKKEQDGYELIQRHRQRRTV
jgi:hypothetical protein